MPARIFPPGKIPSYSNYGFTLAGYIVERVSGEKFERYIENHILKPLGMNNSTFDQPLPAAARAANVERVISARPKSRAISNLCKRRQPEHSPRRLLT
jgi:CubicO group peptidase (beta-lactamase class C family)